MASGGARASSAMRTFRSRSLSRSALTTRARWALSVLACGKFSRSQSQAGDTFERRATNVGNSATVAAPIVRKMSAMSSVTTPRHVNSIVDGGGASEVSRARHCSNSRRGSLARSE